MKLTKFIITSVFVFIFLIIISFNTEITHAWEYPLFLSKEMITSFDSEIVVNNDGSMIVTEDISVVTDNSTIKHGIYRDYPLTYPISMGFKQRVDFDLIDVQREGRPEDFHTKRLSNGIRIYIGNENTLLRPGSYNYTITYKVDRILGYYEDYDELYYNVTGNGWTFPIDKASVQIILPWTIKQDDIDNVGYTGADGSTDQDSTYSIQYRDDKTIISSKTTLPLYSNEGFTIVLNWPKGYLTQPSQFENSLNFIKDNIASFFAFGSSLFLLVYYFIIWYFKGRDPMKGTKYPIFKPPDNISPALMRYIHKLGFDNKAIAANFVDLAVKGIIAIKENKGKYTIARIKKVLQGLNEDSKIQINQLIPQNKVTLEFSNTIKKMFSEIPKSQKVLLSQTNHRKISKSVAAVHKEILDNLSTQFVNKNSKYSIIGVVLHLAYTIPACILVGIRDPESLPLLFMVVFWNGLVSVFLVMAFSLWVSAYNDKTTKTIYPALILSLFLTPFVCAGVFIFVLASSQSSWILSIALFFPIPIHFIANKALINRTPAGRALQDQIDGFKMFLGTTEKNRLKVLYPQIPLTFSTFEKLLPYAIALDVEKKWADQFAEVFATQPESQGFSTWYTTSSRSFSSSSFASSFGSSMGSAISSSATAPGSSSGSGGGGSSGGGGGGGGGGGW